MDDDPGAPYRINVPWWKGPLVCQTLEQALYALLTVVDRDTAFGMCTQLYRHWHTHEETFDWLIMEGVNASQALIYLLDAALRVPLTEVA